MSKSKKRNLKLAAPKKPEAEAPAVQRRGLVLSTDGVTFQLTACTMPLQEAMRGVEKLYATFQATERAAEQAANQPAPAPAAAPVAGAPAIRLVEPVPEPPAPAEPAPQEEKADPDQPT